MSRDDLLNVNFNIMKAVTEQVVKYSPNCIIVPVANPLDAMCQAVFKLERLPARARRSAWPACSTRRACARSSRRS